MVARPSKKAERTAQILDAFERCVARFGVDGSTLERVAEEAGLQRSLLRHYVGNRDELLHALVDRFLSQSDQMTDQVFDSLPAKKRAEVLVANLFDTSYTDTHFARVAQALFAAAPNHEKLRVRIRGWVQDFTKNIAQEIEKAFPDANASAVFDVAAGVVGIYFNIESIRPLGKIEQMTTASKNAALRLISTLQD